MYNKDDLLDSYFMSNDYKETDIEIATKNINDFIEKYGFELPYQISKFKNKEELKSYMVDRLKTSITGESQTYEPVVMENDKLM